jgi:hypothetical protein
MSVRIVPDDRGRTLSRAPMSPILVGMTAAESSTSKTGHRAAKVGATYRGVRVQVTDGQSRFTLDQIKRAVETAVVKNANALAGKNET